MRYYTLLLFFFFDDHTRGVLGLWVTLTRKFGVCLGLTPWRMFYGLVPGSSSTFCCFLLFDSVWPLLSPPFFALRYTTGPTLRPYLFTTTLFSSALFRTPNSKFLPVHVSKDSCVAHEWRVPIPSVTHTPVGWDSFLSTLFTVGYFRIVVTICPVN